MAGLFRSAKTAGRELPTILENENVPIRYGISLAEILDDRIICRETGGGMVEFPADTVLIATGMKPLHAAADALRRCAPETEVRIVGDAEEVGNICTAVNAAFQAALHI